MKQRSRFKVGELVQRRNRSDGSPPGCRFRGVVCGDYINPVNGEPGAVVMSLAEPGCMQLTADQYLEQWSNDNHG